MTSNQGKPIKKQAGKVEIQLYEQISNLSVNILRCSLSLLSSPQSQVTLLARRLVMGIMSERGNINHMMI
jgi:hypothetical protein